MRGSFWAAHAVALLFFGTLACGEGGVLFAGSVTEGELSAYSHDNSLNPRRGVGVTGATVSIGVDVPGNKCGQGEPVDEGGVFSTEAIYGGTVCTPTPRVLLCFRAPGYEPLRVEMAVDSAQARGRGFMNVTLRRTP